MPNYSALLSMLDRKTDGAVEVVLTEDWMQGRTTYGGLTAALALEAARTLAGSLPIRSAQVAFVGPVGGHIRMVPRLLRRGKNTAYVSVDTLSGDAVMAQSIFAFGHSRKSQLNFSDLPMPEVASPDRIESFSRGGVGPGYFQNFDMKGALGDLPVSGSNKSSLGFWLRHSDDAAPRDATAVLAIADAPPPAALPMLTKFAPLSSMTWMAEFMTDDIRTDDKGWWFAQSTAQLAKDGYSSQSMRLWNRQGEPILVGRQTVAIFA
ncbi:MAG: hypothetical protein Hens3KO_11680 [Henriciella sp.]